MSIYSDNSSIMGEQQAILKNLLSYIKSFLHFSIRYIEHTF